MRYSVNVANFGKFAAPEVFAQVACRAEEAGWDALLVARDLLWSGEPVTYRGNQITINDVVFQPTPVQRPRVGGVWPNKAPMRRAARWDGAIPVVRAGIETAHPPDVSEVRDLVAFLRGCRAESSPSGRSTSSSAA